MPPKSIFPFAMPVCQPLLPILLTSISSKINIPWICSCRETGSNKIECYWYWGDFLWSKTDVFLKKGSAFDLKTIDMIMLWRRRRMSELPLCALFFWTWPWGNMYPKVLFTFLIFHYLTFEKRTSSSLRRQKATTKYECLKVGLCFWRLRLN